MKRIFFIFVTILFLTSMSMYGDFEKTYGGTNSDVGNSVQQTTDGGYIIVGSTESYGAGGSDIYIIKVDANGNEQWSKTFGGSYGDYGYSVQQTTDGGYIIAGLYRLPPGSSWTYNAMYLLKVDASGNSQWSNIYDFGSADSANSVQQTTNGGYITVGSGSNNVCLIKVDASGNTLWTNFYGGTNGDAAYSVQQTTDGGYIIAGYTWSYGNGGSDVYLIKVDANGNEIWTKTYGGTNDDKAYSVQQTTDGGYIIAGYTESFGKVSGDGYIIKVDATGNEEWSKTYGGAGWDSLKSVQQTTDGGYIIAGYTESYGAGGYDAYIIKVDATGNEEWSKTYGGTNMDSANDIKLTTDGSYIIVGYTASYGNGGNDVYLIKTSATSSALPPPPTAEDLKIFGSSKPEYRGTYVPDEGKPLKMKLDGITSGKLRFRIFTLTGETIFDSEISCDSDGNFELNIPTDIASGTYIIKVEGPKFSFTKKLAVLR